MTPSTGFGVETSFMKKRKWGPDDSPQQEKWDGLKKLCVYVVISTSLDNRTGFTPNPNRRNADEIPDSTHTDG